MPCHDACLMDRPTFLLMTIIKKLEALESAAGLSENTQPLQQQLDEFKATQMNDNRVCDEERANLRARVAALEARFKEPVRLQSFWIAEMSSSRSQNVALSSEATAEELYKNLYAFASRPVSGITFYGKALVMNELPPASTLLRDTIFTDADGTSLATQKYPIYIY